MMKYFRNFVKDERSQDHLEYTFLLGFVVLFGAVAFSGPGMRAIWASGTSVLTAANTAAG